MVEQYVAGAMGDSEADAFEEACLRDPDLARRVEVEQRMKLGFEQVARNSEEFVRSSSTGFWQLAVAAGLLVVLTAGVWFLQRGAPKPDERALAAVVPELLYGGTSMRLGPVSEENMPELPRGVVRVAITGSFEAGAAYSVSLDRLHAVKPAQTIASLADQKPASGTELDVMLDSDLLEPGTYSLRVQRQGSGDKALDFSFIKP